MQPKIYSFDEHKIPPERVDSQAIYVIQKLRQAGYSAYLVGGGVRDLLLNQRPKDFDVSTSAQPEEIRALFRNAILIGRRFRLAHVRFGKKIIEVSTFRAGEPDSAEFIVRDNVWGSEEEDVLRRDFTINGLFYDPENQTVIDYVGGFVDVENKILRTIGQAENRFSQDPVRMIRLLKFCARFGFKIHRPTHEALLKCKDHIVKSSSARILEELLRMLESGSAKPFFRLLHQYTLLHLLCPRLAHFIDRDVDQTVLNMLGEVDSEMRKSFPETPDRALPMAALCFPLLEWNLHHLSKESEHPLHLGLVAEEANGLIEDLFSPFFLLPRRLRAIMVFLLTSQFRFVPLDGKPVRRPRLPRDPFVPLALNLLKMRCSLHPDLLPHYSLWSEASFQSHAEEMTAENAPASTAGPLRQRRRRRRRPAP